MALDQHEEAVLKPAEFLLEAPLEAGALGLEVGAPRKESLAVAPAFLFAAEVPPSDGLHLEQVRPDLTLGSHKLVDRTISRVLQAPDLVQQEPDAFGYHALNLVLGSPREPDAAGADEVCCADQRGPEPWPRTDIA